MGFLDRIQASALSVHSAPSVTPARNSPSPERSPEDRRGSNGSAGTSHGSRSPPLGLAERRLFSRTVSMKVELDEGRSGPQVSAIMCAECLCLLLCCRLVHRTCRQPGRFPLSRMPPGRERPQSEDRCIRQPSLHHRWSSSVESAFVTFSVLLVRGPC
jgi:hypothetical protein